MGTRILKTPRLVLRPFTVEDAPAMYANWAGDPQVTRWLRWPPHESVMATRAVLEEWAASYAQPDFYNWAITLQDATLIGSIGVMRAEAGDHLEPGYALGRAWWGRGYATEALRAVVEYLFSEEGVQALSCCHAVGNPASGAVQRKVGFRYGHDAVYHKFDGTPVACKCYLLTKKEFYDGTRND